MLQKEFLTRPRPNSTWQFVLIGRILLPLVILTPLFYSNELAFGVQTAKLTWCGIVSVFSIVYITTYLLKYPLYFKSADLTFFLFIVYITIEHFFIDGNQHNNKLLIFILSFIFYVKVRILADNILNASQLFEILKWTVVSVNALCVVYAIAQNFSICSTFNSNFSVTSTFFHPAVFAGYLAITTPFLSGLLIHRNCGRLNAFKVFCLTTIAFNYYFLIFLDNRASIIGVLIGTLFLLIPKFLDYLRTRESSMSRVKFLICTILAILFLFFFFLIKKRSNSADGRLLVWKIASSLITDNFFFGIGIDKFKYAYPDKQIKYFQSGLGTTREITLSSEVSFTFNDLIQIQIETGIIGLAICIVATFQAYKNFQYYKKNKSSFWQLQLASLSGITSLLVYSNFSYPFSTVELTVTFFLLVAIVNSGIGRHVKKRMSAFSISILLIFFSVLALYSWERIYTFTRQMHFLDLAYKYSQTNRNLEATRTFKHLTKDNAMIRNPGFMSYYSRFLLGLGKYKEAESLLRKKNNILPSYDDLIELAATYELLGDTSLAIGTYWKAYFLLPHKFKPIYHIMLVHERRREGDRAKLLAKYLLTKPIKVRSTEVLKMRSTASLILNR